MTAFISVSAFEKAENVMETAPNFSEKFSRPHEILNENNTDVRQLVTAEIGA